MDIKITISDIYLSQLNKISLTKNGIYNPHFSFYWDDLKNKHFCGSGLYQNWGVNLYYKIDENILLSAEDLSLISQTNKIVNHILTKELWKNQLQLSRSRKLLNSLKTYSDLYTGNNLALNHILKNNKQIITYIRDGDFKSNIEKLLIDHQYNLISYDDNQFLLTLNDSIELSLDYFDLFLSHDYLLLFNQTVGIGETNDRCVSDIDNSYIEIVDQWLRKSLNNLTK